MKCIKFSDCCAFGRACKEVDIMTKVFSLTAMDYGENEWKDELIRQIKDERS